MSCALRALCAMQLEEEAASVSQQQWGTRKQLVVFFGNAGIGTRGGWGAEAVLQACREVVERPYSGEPTDGVPGKVVTVDEFRTSGVSSIMNSPQPCEEELDSSKPTRPEDWEPKPGQVQNRLLRSAWSKRFEAPVRGLMWCPWLAQATPGDLGKWVDRDCNATLNLQRAGESKWRPLELCSTMSRLARPVKTEPGFLLFIPRVMLGVLTLGALGVAAGLAGPGRGFKDEAEFRKVMQERRHELKRHSPQAIFRLTCRCNDRVEDFVRVVVGEDGSMWRDMRPALGQIWRCLRSQPGSEPDTPYRMLQPGDHHYISPEQRRATHLE
ncbi:hypothetical protein QJQ45_015347 [Haematococcus lacustris]|nr:hypothetical protein QJQ45_015347 [Haematococcus lacustris]